MLGGHAGRSTTPRRINNILVALKRLTVVDAFEEEHAVRIDDPTLRDFPFLYMLEVGALDLDDKQTTSLRDYLNAGGFLIVDDFWGYLGVEQF